MMIAEAMVVVMMGTDSMLCNGDDGGDDSDENPWWGCW